MKNMSDHIKYNCWEEFLSTCEPMILKKQPICPQHTVLEQVIVIDIPLFRNRDMENTMEC